MLRLVDVRALMACAYSASADRFRLQPDSESGRDAPWLKSKANGWKTHRMRVVSASDDCPVRFGTPALRLDVRPGDCGNNGGWGDCTADRER